MSLLPFATDQDVADRWRPLTDDELAVAAVLVGDASSVLRARFPGLDAQVASGLIDPNILRIVVAGMVMRALIAPEPGVSQESEKVGPIAHGRTFANPMRKMFILDDELLLIEGYRPRAGSFRYGNDTTNVEGVGPGYVYGYGSW